MRSENDEKNKTDYKTSADIIAKKPISEIDKNDRAMIQARMKEIKKYRNDISTTQNTIGYIQMFKDGVCQVTENKFSKTIQFFDTNYQLAEFEEQNNIFSKYCDLINYFDNTITFQLTFENQNRSQDKLVKQIQIPEQEDEFNNIRKEYSEMLTTKLLSGRNGQSCRKFLTFTIESSGYKQAKAKLLNIQTEVIKMFKAFGVEAKALNGKERLETLYYSLNPFRQTPFVFDWNTMLRAGLDTKDFIAPSSFKFSKQDFEIGDAIGAINCMSILAGELPDTILNDFLELQHLFCVNIHVEPLDQVSALKFVKLKLTGVEEMKINEQKKASKAGYDPDILPPAIKMYITDLEKLLDDLNSKNERLFHINISIRNYARNKKDLKLQLELLKRICQKNNCTLMSCDYLQEDYLTSTLPLGVNNILVSREMHTSGVAIFVPFTTQELFQHNGTYYGLNTCFDIKILGKKLKLQGELAVMDGGKCLKPNKKAIKKILDHFIFINITL